MNHNDTSAKVNDVDESMSLFEKYQAHPSEATRNELVVRYLHIARIIAMRFSGKGVDYDDLYQVASLALIKAVERFDPNYGVLFQSYATPKMVGEVKNYFRDKLHTLNLPRKSAALVKQIEITRAELSQKLMRSPTMHELVDASGLPEGEVIEALAMQGAMYPASLDTQQDEEDSPISTFVGVEDLDFQRFELKETIEKLLVRLDDTSRQVLTERYFNEWSQREVAEKMGVSQMTVSRIERRALDKVREMLSQ